jgi:hypothetical protein
MKFQTNMLTRTPVAVAQKLGNPTSSPGAHFRHQNQFPNEILNVLLQILKI